MKLLSDVELVALAARCDAGPPVDAALAALAMAWPEVAAAQWPALDAGRRDALLLHLRRGIFGDQLQAECACPSCGERLEFDLQAGALAGARPSPLHELPPLTVVVDGLGLTLRRPSTGDLQQAPSATALMQHCLLSDDPTAQRACGEAAWQQAFGAALAQDNPCTDPQIGLDCPACGARWEETFDIADFMAADLRAAARRLFDEVHLMALAYHWSERDILELPAARRRHYLRRLDA